jgi:hypothetical protein
MILYRKVESIKTFTSSLVGGTAENGDLDRIKGFLVGKSGFVLMFCQSKNEGDILLRLSESTLDCPDEMFVCCAIVGVDNRNITSMKMLEKEHLIKFFILKVKTS